MEGAFCTCQLESKLLKVYFGFPNFRRCPGLAVCREEIHMHLHPGDTFRVEKFLRPVLPLSSNASSRWHGMRGSFDQRGTPVLSHVTGTLLPHWRIPWILKHTWGKFGQICLWRRELFCVGPASYETNFNLATMRQG